MRPSILFGGMLLLGASAGAQGQASLASRIATVRDGTVRMEFAARPETCGNGRDMIAYRNAFFSRNVESWGGRWSAPDCRPGAVRVALTMRNGQPTEVRTEIGGSWRATDERITELGAVNPAEASAYFFSIAPRLDDAYQKGRVLMPAVLGADVEVLAPLRRLANDDARSDQLRRQAIQWLGLLGDASVIPDLMRIARAGDAGSKKSLATSALAALAGLQDDAGVPSLLDLSRHSSADLRREVVFWLGQTEDPRAVRWLRQVIEDRSEAERVRSHAIFSLGQSQAAPTKDLIDIYHSIGDATLKEQAIFALSQRQDTMAVDALLDIVKSDDDKRMRGKAMFWLAQKSDPRVKKLISDILVK